MAAKQFTNLNDVDRAPGTGDILSALAAPDSSGSGRPRQELDVDGLAGSRDLSDYVHRVIRYNDDITRREHAHIRVLTGSAPQDVGDTTDGVREGRERPALA